MHNKETQPHVLIIDDDPVSLRIAQELLISNGYTVSTAAEAADGLEFAIKKKPQLILLDVMMPVINGFNVCRLLKSEQDCMKIPIILVTARSREEDMKIGAEVGADAYVAKPFLAEELLTKVRQLIAAR